MRANLAARVCDQSPEVRAWVRDQAAKILDGMARDARAGIRRRATTYGNSAAEREAADTCAAYLENKRDYLTTPRSWPPDGPSPRGLIEGAAR